MTDVGDNLKSCPDIRIASAHKPIAPLLPESAIGNDPQRVAQAAAAGVGNGAEVHPIQAQVLTVPHTLRDNWESDVGARNTWECDGWAQRQMMGLKTVESVMEVAGTVVLVTSTGVGTVERVTMG